MTIIFACVWFALSVACNVYFVWPLMKTAGPDENEDDVAAALEGSLIPFVSDLNRTKV